jgi:hypothetical protein
MNKKLLERCVMMFSWVVLLLGLRLSELIKVSKLEIRYTVPDDDFIQQNTVFSNIQKLYYCNDNNIPINIKIITELTY